MRIITGTEAACDSVAAVVDKALGYPKKGTHVGGGIHVDMPATWDGQGATPPGWTKRHTTVYTASPSDAALQLEAATVAAVQASGLVNASEILVVTSAAGVTQNVPDPSNGGARTPKASASPAVGAAEAEAETKR